MMDIRSTKEKVIDDLDYMINSLNDVLTEIVSATEHDDFNVNRILNTPISLLKIRSMLRVIRHDVSQSQTYKKE
jgi:hypothetical protein